MESIFTILRLSGYSCFYRGLPYFSLIFQDKNSCQKYLDEACDRAWVHGFDQFKYPLNIMGLLFRLTITLQEPYKVLYSFGTWKYFPKISFKKRRKIIFKVSFFDCDGKHFFKTFLVFWSFCFPAILLIKMFKNDIFN